MIRIPSEFSERVFRMRGQAAAGWLDSLHERLSFCEKHWNLKVMQQPFELSYNYVVPVVFNTKTSGVLKVCLPGDYHIQEIETLRYYNGIGMCKLIDSLADGGIILMERCEPGINLKTVSTEEDAVRIVSSIVKRMKTKRERANFKFRTQSDFISDIDKAVKNSDKHLGQAFYQNAKRVSAIFPHLISSERDTYLLHGDLHHENILLDNGEWKAIDPKGIIGEVELELIPFLNNHLPVRAYGDLIEKRVRAFKKELDIDLERLFAWGLCYSLLSVWWNVEDRLSISDTELGLVDFFSRKINTSD